MLDNLPKSFRIGLFLAFVVLFGGFVLKLLWMALVFSAIILVATTVWEMMHKPKP